jgi:UDP-N-acetylmuramoyl-tripeptide--D-alanyl-D-alanine ligase
MALWTIGEILRVLGQDSEDQTPVENIVTDPYRSAPGSIFMPRESKSNSKEVGRWAIARGATAAILAGGSQLKPPLYSAGVRPLANLRKLAVHARGRLEGKIVLVTGSVGKTTTTQMTKAALADFGSVTGTEGNRNLGFQTMLGIINTPIEADFCVLECAAGSRGLSKRSFVARPNIAIITNIGHSHMANHGTREKLAQNKFSVAHHLARGGKVICDKDGLDFALSTGSVSAHRIKDRAITVGKAGDI